MSPGGGLIFIFVIAVSVHFVVVNSSLKTSRNAVDESNPNPNQIGNCSIRDYSTISCIGDFNISEFLLHQRLILSQGEQNQFFPWTTTYRNFEILNSSIETIDENLFQLHGFTFETILIEDAPKLICVQPNALATLKDKLTDFRAINTNLPNYNDFGNEPNKNQNPFRDFVELHEVYIGEQSRCPEDKKLLHPCDCKFGYQSRALASGLYGTSWGISNAFGTTTQIICGSKNMTGDDLKEIFLKISDSNHMPKHFDVLTLQDTKGIKHIPSQVFGNITFTAVWMNGMTNLTSIDENAFVGQNQIANHVAKSIQVLEINDANFTRSNPSKIFKAFSSLINIRLLRINKCGIQYIPSFAFVPKNTQDQLTNLRILNLSFDRKKYSSGIKSVGNYAFSGAPNLIALGLLRNYIERFDSFAFAFNRSSNRPLKVDIGGNPFNDSYGLRPNAFSGSQRPLHIKFEIDSFAASDVANDPNLHFMPENVFRPFIEENLGNYFEVEYFNVDIWCDCKSKWMFEENGYLKSNVQNGLQIKRVEDNTVSSDPLSIQCKELSSYECLPNCLVFPLNRLMNCGASKHFDVRKEFEQLARMNGSENISSLQFSSKGISELEKGAFGNFQFKQIRLTGCRNLSSIHSDAFGASTQTMTQFSATNTSLTKYPNFATFPNLERIQLDDFYSYHLNSDNFDFTQYSRNSSAELSVSMDKGTIDPSTFTKLNNEVNITLSIGKATDDCSTIACLIQCTPSQLKLEEKIFKPFLEANQQNKVSTKCYLECSCELKWMYENWKQFNSQISIWLTEYFGRDFFCVPRGTNLTTDDNFFGVNITAFNYGSYFAENCN